MAITVTWRRVIHCIDGLLICGLSQRLSGFQTLYITTNEAHSQQVQTRLATMNMASRAEEPNTSMCAQPPALALTITRRIPFNMPLRLMQDKQLHHP